jgi:hypothetical protein
MANITTKLSNHNTIEVIFAGKQAKHLRLTDVWTDWMLVMNDFRDLISPLRKEDANIIITKLLKEPNRLQFVNTDIGQEYGLSGDKKIVRRSGPGNTRKLYQSVALFIKNDTQTWPPEQIEIKREELLLLIRAMITLDRPDDHCITDSLRNLQYLLAILWVKKANPKLLQGTKKPNANEIFRISLVK